MDDRPGEREIMLCFARELDFDRKRLRPGRVTRVQGVDSVAQAAESKGGKSGKRGKFTEILRGDRTRTRVPERSKMNFRYAPPTPTPPTPPTRPCSPRPSRRSE